MNAEEYKELLMRIDEKERQLVETAAESQSTWLDSGNEKASRTTHRKPKLKKSKNGVKKREPAKKRERREKREKRKEQRKMVHGLGNLLDQLDIHGRGREDQRKHDQGMESGLNEKQFKQGLGTESSGMDFS